MIFSGFYRWTLTQNLYKRGDSSEWSGIFVKLEEPKMFKAVAFRCPPYILHHLLGRVKEVYPKVRVVPPGWDG